VWAAVSPDAKDMIKKLLLVDPRQRLTVGDVLSHPWCRAKAPGRQELLKVCACVCVGGGTGGAGTEGGSGFKTGEGRQAGNRCAGQEASCGGGPACRAQQGSMRGCAALTPRRPRAHPLPPSPGGRRP
jgi:hypothetical protein